MTFLDFKQSESQKSIVRGNYCVLFELSIIFLGRSHEKNIFPGNAWGKLDQKNYSHFHNVSVRVS